jgi:glycosyltransferase involved in cell wall biosynthesis
MDFDIVIATRNRQDILKLSLATMLSQARLPARLIVVDSSDDHAATSKTVKNAVDSDRAKLDVQVIFSAQRGTSHQRNIGLGLVESPIVFFPDDDALWFPGTAGAVMQIYERDVNATIGFIAPLASTVPPPGILEMPKQPHRMEFRDRLTLLLRPLRKAERSLFPDPVNSDSWLSAGHHPAAPDWLSELNAEVCGPVAGFRMTFRSELIRSIGFDESLGQYALYEDYDATTRSLRDHLNVLARSARVFHYRVPGPRAPGRDFGIMAILNRTYIVCKHSTPDSAVRKELKRFLYWQVLRYSAQASTSYGRDRLYGAWHAFRNIGPLLRASNSELPAKYADLRQKLSGPSE